MTALIAPQAMDTSHLLQAEADVAGLSDGQLVAAGADPNCLDDLRQRLRQGWIFYCVGHPQLPYVVYCRGKYYLNPHAQQCADKIAMECLQQRFHTLHRDNHQAPVADLPYRLKGREASLRERFGYFFKKVNKSQRKG